MIASLLLCLTAADRPNVVLFLVDDLGWADVSFNNPDTFYETPRLQELAGRSAVFTNAYAANPVCSPTRFSVMTGRWPSRADATNYFSGKREEAFAPAPLNNRMPLEETTLAELLKDAGYRTAFLGKWHLGPTEEFGPLAQGFDVNVGGHHAGHPKSYFSPYKNPHLDDGPEGEHLTERLTVEAEKLVADFAASGDPFFVDLSFYTVHTPLQAPKDLVEKYRRKAESLGRAVAKRGEFPDGLFDRVEQNFVPPPKPDGQPRPRRTVQSHPTYAAMVETMDTAVGRVVDALEAAGELDDTLIVFTSDNGGLSTSEGWPTSNLPLNGGKGWLYEGGVREPFLIFHAGLTGGGTVDTPVCTIDILPTVCEAAGVAVPDDVDGVSLLPLLRGEDIAGRDLYWHYPHYANQGGFPGGAIRRGDWKLLERYEDGRVHLYNLAEDVGETSDVAGDHPDRVAEMRGRLHEWYEEVDAKFLRPKDGRTPWSP